jgi:hypothetical protein
MRGLKTTLTATAAAGVTALAITVTASGAGGDGGGPAKVERRTDGPTPAALVACLQSHGATGLPSPDAGDGRALKEWIVAHQDDPAARPALKACDVWFDVKKAPEGGGIDKAPCAAPAPGDEPKARTGRVAGDEI